MPKTLPVDELTLEERLRVARNVKHVRTHLKLSQGDLAVVLGLSQNQFSAKENGGPWSWDDITRIARAVGMESYQLVGPLSSIPFDALRWMPPTPGPHRPERIRPIRTRKKQLPRLDSNQEPAGYRPGRLPVAIAA